ncbi:MAG: polymer-forming cytoskeletal protein [Ferruginibacter sp.]
MFNSKSKLSFDDSTAGSTTIIGAGTVITGNVTSNGDIRIDGTIKGNLISKAKILVGAQGLIEGDVNGKLADVLGKVKGTIQVSDLLFLHGNAVVDGDICAGKLQVEPTATFNGKCQMGANVVELVTERANAVNE